ncbi:aldehyde dehydrogenase family protein, partial [Actinomadura luteofluorescens]|uniref:aldehyde dehydrogenase family protein n=1 Tax=Actinomadura luteofluorescens TaxID=46163 RepID=UPI0031D7AE3C
MAAFEFDYAPAPESRSVVDIRGSYGLFVDGEFTGGHGEPFKTINPADEGVLAEVACADEADVNRAVRAARTAYDKVWGPMPGTERAKYLYRIARIV